MKPRTASTKPSSTEARLLCDTQTLGMQVVLFSRIRYQNRSIVLSPLRSIEKPCPGSLEFNWRKILCPWRVSGAITHVGHGLPKRAWWAQQGAN